MGGGGVDFPHIKLGALRQSVKLLIVSSVACYVFVYNRFIFRRFSHQFKFSMVPIKFAIIAFLFMPFFPQLNLLVMYRITQ